MMRTGPSRRTQAERDAIDARAAAWVRPISAKQSDALAALRRGPLEYSRAGWAPRQSGGLGAFPTQTVVALMKRGFARSDFAGRARIIRITDAGRAELRLHPSRLRGIA